MNKHGKYYHSELRSTMAANWGKDPKLKPAVSKLDEKLYPRAGPGYYEQYGDMYKQCSPAAQYKGSAFRRFGSEKR